MENLSGPNKCSLKSYTPTKRELNDQGNVVAVKKTSETDAKVRVKLNAVYLLLVLSCKRFNFIESESSYSNLYRSVHL